MFFSRKIYANETTDEDGIFSGHLLVVHADSSVAQSGAFQGGREVRRLLLEFLGEYLGRGLRAPQAGVRGSGLVLPTRTGPDRGERLAGGAMLGAACGDGPVWHVIG